MTLDESALNATESKEEGTDSQDESVIVVKTEKTESTSKTENDGGDDDDDDVIEITPQEPSITEILDEDEDMSVSEIIPIAIDEKTPEELTTTVDVAIKKDGVANEESDPDVEIQEPHIPITDLDDIEDNPTSSMDDIQISNGSPFTNIKIKEEPKDDDEIDEEDAFEDVGTVVGIPNINNVDDGMFFFISQFQFN